MPRTNMGRQFVMLAHTFDPDKHHVNGWFLSEKRDGRRAFWDGGVSRGRSTMLVPWANIEKRAAVRPIATGLWSRLGNVINAPDWFLDGLPKNVILDGELFTERSDLEELGSIVSEKIPSPRWSKVFYEVFDSPSKAEFCRSGQINIGKLFSRYINEHKCLEYAKALPDLVMPFQRVVKELPKLVLPDHVRIMVQEELPSKGHIEAIYEALDRITALTGEGVMLRRPFSYWTPQRSHHLLKVKPLDDDEAVVVGYVAGIGKHYGRIGSIEAMWGDKLIHIAGLTDAERYVPDRDLFEIFSGSKVPDYNVARFPVGSVITFKYTGVTKKEGKPREARYWRNRPTQE